MARASNHRMIRVPIPVAERLERLAADYMRAYEEGRTDKIEITEQGTKGAWVPLHAVITKALDHLDAHKARSRRKKSKPTVNTPHRFDCILSNPPYSSV